MDKIIDKNNSTGAVSIRRVIIMGGAFIGLLIGSGFTTGQEIMQYFVAWGYGGYAAVAMMFILFCYVGISFVTVGAEQKFEEPKNIYQYYCGKYIGNFFDWFSVVFLFMSFWVMTAGAGAAFNQSFGWPTWMGGTLMGVVTIITLFFGFNKLVDIVGSIGPVVSVLAICLGIAGIMMNPEGLSTFAEQVKPLVADGTVKAAGENWFFIMCFLCRILYVLASSIYDKHGRYSKQQKRSDLWNSFRCIVILISCFSFNVWFRFKLSGSCGSSNTNFNYC